MKSFFFDIGRGVTIGLIVWFILRPDEPAFARIGHALDDGRKMGETFVGHWMAYPSEQVWIAGGCGLLVSLLLWSMRSGSGSGSGKQRSTGARTATPAKRARAKKR